jgi:hypothetical protein
MLNEALSRIIRASLLLILENRPLPHFTDAAASEAYFGGHSLTNSALKVAKSKQL